jgi:tetratricopeptide (TPR) repeat protein
MKKFFLLFFLFCNFIFPNNQIKNLVKTGLTNAYNFQIEKAFDIFDDIIKKYPKEPEGYHYKSTIYLWFYLSNNETQNFNNFMSLSDQAIELANQKIKDEKDIEDSKFILGLNYGFRGMTFGKAERYLEMIWAFKESYANLEDIIKLNPNNYDAYLGLGLFKFTLDQIPAAFQWALDVIGFEGDISTGLNYLKTAAEKGDLVKIEAQFYLSQIYKDFYFD